jgi:DNA-binding beta-propeller fold protein YncE
MKRTVKAFAAAVVLAGSATLIAQSAPDIPFDSNADLLKTPAEGAGAIFIGEIGGVGQNSKGQIYVYTRTGHPYATLADNRTFERGGSRLLVFDRTGKFERELGQDVYGFNAAIGLRIDPQDNVWTIDEVASQIIKFDPEGRVLLVLGRKPEAISVRPAGPGGGRGAGAEGGGGAAAAGRGAAGGAPAAGGRGGAPVEAAGGGRGGGRGPAGAGTPGSTFNRPTDVAWDKAGNIYIADGIGNTNRVEKFDKDGKYIKQWGSTGSENGQFNGVKSLAVDAQDNIYVADLGNKRIQVFDADGNFKTSFGNIGNPLTMCMTKGPTQYLYIAHSAELVDGMEEAAIYKVQLNGTVVGKFGTAGRQPKQFGLVNSIDCRNENDLLVGEMANWRVQKVTLRAAR